MRRAASLISHLAQHVPPQRKLHQLHQAIPQTNITTLPNKFRVVTEATPGHLAAVGLYIDAGARYETPSTSGVSHFLDRMAFKTTSSRSESEMSRVMNALGGQIMCSSTRETIMYQSCHFHKSTPLALSLIADSVTNALFLPEEIEAQREAARYEFREIKSKPEVILPEILHQVAYGGKTLGNLILCPEDRIDVIDSHMLRECVRNWYRPERMVIAGAGVQHEELVELADKFFSSLKVPAQTIPQPSLSRSSGLSPSISPHFLPSPSSSIAKTLARAASSYLFPSAAPPPSDPSLAAQSFDSRLPASYTGGHRFLLDTSSEFNHIYVAFEGVGVHDDDIYTLATMQVLLGGGGSFSAGGPGKGMYSRLYTHVLNRFSQIDHCASFHHIYTDSSLFGLFASAYPQPSTDVAQVLPHLVHQLSMLLYSPVQQQELSRAKNQLKSSLVMALESRAVEVEDLGRQILVHGRKVEPSEMIAKIDDVTAESVRRVAARLFGRDSGRKTTILCMGREDVGDWRPIFRKYGVTVA